MNASEAALYAPSVPSQSCVPQPDLVVVERAHIDHARSLAVVAVLLVVAHAHHDAHHADPGSQRSAQPPKAASATY